MIFLCLLLFILMIYVVSCFLSLTCIPYFVSSVAVAFAWFHVINALVMMKLVQYIDLACIIINFVFILTETMGTCLRRNFVMINECILEHLNLFHMQSTSSLRICQCPGSRYLFYISRICLQTFHLDAEIYSSRGFDITADTLY